MNSENPFMRRAVVPRSSTQGSSPELAPIKPNRPLPPTLVLCLVALTAAGQAQQTTSQPAPRTSATAAAGRPLPSAPSPQSPAQAAGAGTISGIITDTDDASIPGARITLTRITLSQNSPSAKERASPPPVVALSASDGAFTFANIPPGPFTLAIAAPGFATRQLNGELLPAESLNLPTIVLGAGATADVQVNATQIEIAQAQVGEEEKQRVLGIIPNFYVSYVSDPAPLSPGQKFQLAYRTLIDPVSLVLNGAAAGAEQATDTYAWGEGAQGYAKRYAAAYGNFLTSDMLGNALFPILFKQDPRYFFKGTGSIHSRILYAIANSVICKGDNLRWQPNYSAILGGFASGALSNLYYPAPDRSGVALTFESAGIGTLIGAAGNLFQEFLIPRLTPHIPPKAPTYP
jgi:Carboxypeptidase regulatory-like domain